MYGRNTTPKYLMLTPPPARAPAGMQVLHEVYRQQHQWISSDDRALEQRVFDEIGVCVWR